MLEEEKPIWNRSCSIVSWDLFFFLVWPCQRVGAQGGGGQGHAVSKQVVLTHIFRERSRVFCSCRQTLWLESMSLVERYVVLPSPAVLGTPPEMHYKHSNTVLVARNQWILLVVSRLRWAWPRVVAHRNYHPTDISIWLLTSNFF